VIPSVIPTVGTPNPPPNVSVSVAVDVLKIGVAAAKPIDLIKEKLEIHRRIFQLEAYLHEATDEEEKRLLRHIKESEELIEEMKKYGIHANDVCQGKVRK
jgi:hypothetical protein